MDLKRELLRVISNLRKRPPLRRGGWLITDAQLDAAIRRLRTEERTDGQNRNH